MIECLRCGKCCHFYTADNPDKLRKCRYLRITSDNKTYCGIYNLRERAKWKPFLVYTDKTGGQVYCLSRAEQKAIIAGCPLNADDIQKSKE